jgi:hypothetical protein
MYRMRRMTASNASATSQRQRSLRFLKQAQRAQARGVGAPYGGPTVPEQAMAHWLAVAATELRESKGRKHVHIAAGANVDQSTVWRFEREESFPRDMDALVAAYADDLDVRPIDIWRRALGLWSEATLSDRAAVEAETETQARQSERTAAASAKGTPGRARKGRQPQRRP